MDTPSLVYLTSYLQAKEIVPLAESSSALRRKLSVEITDRRVRDMLPAWEQKVRARIDEASALASSLTHPLGNRQELALLARHLFALGRPADAMQALRLRDWGGNSGNDSCERAQMLLAANRPDDAIALASTLMREQPDDPATFDELPVDDEPRLIIALALLLQGKPHDANDALKSVANTNSVKLAMAQAMVAHSLGESPQPALHIALNRFDGSPYWATRHSQMAEVFAWLGDADKALNWMEMASRAPYDEHLARIPLSPFARAIQDNPLWKPLRLRAEQIRGTTDIALPMPKKRG